MSIQIVGKANIYDSIKSLYKVSLTTQGEAEDYYKLLKALFILETQLSHHYKFEIKLDKKGSIHFYNNNKEIDYEGLLEFIKSEYIKGLQKIIKAKENKINLEKKLKSLKNISKNLDSEYFEKEKQIATFLECKKTFFGRVRYFFKYKKTISKEDSNKTLEKEENPNLKYCERTEIKEAYTLEELLNLYINLDQELSNVKDLEQDIEAMHNRVDMLKIKLENAKKYIKEIDKHKKSIFDFWKFTNKDDPKQLNEGTKTIVKNKKLKKSFNYELDFEDISKQFDKTEREVFAKEDTDKIFVASTEVIKDLNLVLNNQEIPEENLEIIKNKLTNTDKITQFDIFGSMIDSKENIKTLGNIRHRENEKNLYTILNLKDTTTIEEYTNRLKNIVMGIQNCINKFENIIEMAIYKVGNLEDGFNVFYINPENAIKQALGKETNLYKITLKEDTKCLPLTNIIYYNNTNKTLPIGMFVTDGILLNTKELNLNLIEKKQNYIINLNKQSKKPEPLRIDIHEYSID